MGYYDFPHTRNYDSDLGFLIKRYKELIEEYKIVNDKYDTLLKIYEMVQKDIKDVTIEQLQKWLDDGTFETIINQIVTNLTKIEFVESFPDVEDEKTIYLKEVFENDLTENNILIHSREYNQYLFNKNKVSNELNNIVTICSQNIEGKSGFRDTTPTSGFFDNVITKEILKSLWLETQANIVCLQEFAYDVYMPQEECKTKYLNNVDSFATIKDIFPGFNLGNGILSDRPNFIRHGNVYNSKSNVSNEFRGYINNVFKYNNKNLSVYSVHIDHDNNVIQAQLDELFNVVNNDTNEYIIICGDFNFNQDNNTLLSKFLQNGYTKVNNGQFNTFMNVSPIDQILVNKNCEIVESEMFNFYDSNNEIYTTDHNPLIAKIRLKEVM